MIAVQKRTRPVRPRPAASLILFWQSPDGTHHVFMGRRGDALAFLPGFLVFPGGRVEPPELAPGADLLSPGDTDALENEGMGFAAQFLGAALRECLEETGFDPLPHLDGRLCYCARAVTPPAMPIRYDTRFFAGQLAASERVPQPHLKGDGELLTPGWYAVDELHHQQLHHVTEAVFKHALRQVRDRARRQPRLLVADRKPKGWTETLALRSRHLKAAKQAASSAA